MSSARRHRTFAAVLLLLHLLFSPILSQSADCSEPSQSVLVARLTDLLLNFDGGLTYSPTLIGSVHYVCQAQGSSRRTYRSLSIIATYTPNTKQSQTTSIFQLSCNSGLWEADLSGGLSAPVAGLINIPTRTDCAQCHHNFGDDRCHGELIYNNLFFVDSTAHLCKYVCAGSMKGIVFCKLIPFSSFDYYNLTLSLS